MNDGNPARNLFNVDRHTFARHRRKRVMRCRPSMPIPLKMPKTIMLMGCRSRTPWQAPPVDARPFYTAYRTRPTIGCYTPRLRASPSTPILLKNSHHWLAVTDRDNPRSCGWSWSQWFPAPLVPCTTWPLYQHGYVWHTYMHACTHLYNTAVHTPMADAIFLER
jgi:hypothetical protein